MRCVGVVGDNEQLLLDGALYTALIEYVGDVVADGFFGQQDGVGGEGDEQIGVGGDLRWGDC
jgi:hypothetical protein